MVRSLDSIRDMATPPPEDLALHPRIPVLPNTMGAAPAGSPAGPIDQGDVEMDAPAEGIDPLIDPALQNHDTANALATLQNAANQTVRRSLTQYLDPLVASYRLRNEARIALKRFLEVFQLFYHDHKQYLISNTRPTPVSRSP